MTLVLHLLAPNILSRSGHNYHQLRELRDAAVRRGAGCRIHLPREVCDDGLVTELGAERSIDHVSVRHFPDPVAEIGSANYRFYEHVQALGPFGSADLVFLLTAHHRNVYGFMKAMDERAAAGHAGGFAALLWSQECYAGPDGEIHRRNSEIFRRFVVWCQERPALCRGLFAFSSAHVAHLEGLPGARLRIPPFPFIVPTLAALPRTQDAGTARLGYFGLSWWDQKGLGVFLSALRRLLAANSGVTATVQVDVTGAVYDAESMLAAHADVLEHRRVRRLHGGLESDRYARELAACDVLVLPYGPAYDRQESGILHEAAALGRAVVVPRSSLANARLRDHGVAMPTFSAWTPEEVADACCRALTDHAALGTRMAEAADRLNREFTADNLLDRLKFARTS